MEIQLKMLKDKLLEKRHMMAIKIQEQLKDTHNIMLKVVEPDTSLVVELVLKMEA